MPFHSNLHSTQAIRSPKAELSASLTAVAFVILGALFLLQGQAVAQEADGSATVPISIEPSTGLSDGQQVQIAVRQPSPEVEGLFILQCREGSNDPNDCVGNTWVGFANQQLAADSVTVWRSINTPNGSFDCALEGCTIGGYTDPYRNGQTQSELLARGLLTFNPDIPELSRPTITVSPIEGLIDGDELTITGQGFQPFERVDIAICTAVDGAFRQIACTRGSNDSAEIDGTLVAEATATRFISTYHTAGGADCAKQICTLHVRVVDQPDLGIAGAPPGRAPATPIVSFADIPFERDLPLVTTSPRNGLIDRQVVTVRIGGQTQNHYATIMQCPTGSADLALCAPLQSTRAERSGEGVAFDVNVRRILRVGDVGHGGGSVGGAPDPIDCAVVPKSCTISAVIHDEVLNLVPSARALTFDAQVPPGRAVVTIESRNKIVAGGETLITVSSNSNQWVEVRQCPRTATSHEEPGCTRIGWSHRSSETLSLTTRPTRFLDAGTETPVDCLAPRSCDFRVFGSDGPIRRLLINFVGDTTPLPEFSVATQRDLTHGQRVSATVSAPNMAWTIRQCIFVDAPTNHGARCIGTGATNTNGRNAPPDLSSEPIDTTVKVSRFVGSFDCAEEPRSCALQLAVGGTPVARKTLVFTFVETKPSGILDAKPRRDLVEGQQITVTASGSRPGHVLIAQCLKEVQELVDEFDTMCRFIGGANQRPDLNIYAEVPVQVHRLIAGVDCAESAGRCVLRSVESWPTFTDKWVNLRFDADAEGGPPTFTVQPRRDLIHGQTITVGSPSLDGVSYVQVSQCAVIGEKLATGSCSTVGWFSGDDEPNEESTGPALPELHLTNAEADSDLEILATRGPKLSVTNVTGSPKVDVEVRRYVGASGADSLWDCASGRNGCVLLFSIQTDFGGYPTTHTAGLSFDPDGPDAEDTKLSVQPRRNLADRQTVQVKVSDVLPGVVVVRQCARSTKTKVDNGTCQFLNWTETKGLNKPSKLDVRVSRYLDNNSGEDEPVDCVVAEFSCVIRVETGGGHGSAGDTNTKFMKSVAITFDAEATAEPIAPITLTISPDTPLSDTADVTVSGASLNGGPIAVAQCSLSASGELATCNTETVEFLDVPSPQWEIEMTVVRRFTDGDEIDCVVTSCAIVAFGFADDVRPFARSEELVFDAFQALDTAATE